jgi:hypothetical protein
MVGAEGFEPPTLYSQRMATAFCCVWMESYTLSKSGISRLCEPVDTSASNPTLATFSATVDQGSVASDFSRVAND